MTQNKNITIIYTIYTYTTYALLFPLRGVANGGATSHPPVHSSHILTVEEYEVRRTLRAVNTEGGEHEESCRTQFRLGTGADGLCGPVV